MWTLIFGSITTHKKQLFFSANYVHTVFFNRKMNKRLTVTLNLIFQEEYKSEVTLGEEILTYTTMGAREVLSSCDGWLMVSQSRTTSCKVRASSNILSISAWTSAAKMKQNTLLDHNSQ